MFSASTDVPQNYAVFAILVALAYDHVLTFSKEIDYIWSQPWTSVTLLFVLVRYVGLYGFVVPFIMMSNILPVSNKSCEIVSVFLVWTFLLFLGAADFTMILRVWAMYDRSRLILSVLITLFVVEIIFTVLVNVIISIPRNHLATPTFNASLCLLNSSPIWFEVSIVLQLIHGAVMCILALVRFVRQSLLMYSATRNWTLNRYMSLLVKQGILHFFAFFLTELNGALFYLGITPAGGWQATVLLILEYVPVLVLTPRFILNVRELYARDLGGRRDGGIDTGFGLLTDHSAVGTGIVFADVEQDEGAEEIPMVDGTTRLEEADA